MKPFLASLLLVAASASPQVPESGRVQELLFSAEEVSATSTARSIWPPLASSMKTAAY